MQNRLYLFLVVLLLTACGNGRSALNVYKPVEQKETLADQNKRSLQSSGHYEYGYSYTVPTQETPAPVATTDNPPTEDELIGELESLLNELDAVLAEGENKE